MGAPGRVSARSIRSTHRYVATAVTKRGHVRQTANGVISANAHCRANVVQMTRKPLPVTASVAARRAPATPPVNGVTSVAVTSVAHVARETRRNKTAAIVENRSALAATIANGARLGAAWARVSAKQVIRKRLTVATAEARKEHAATVVNGAPLGHVQGKAYAHRATSPTLAVYPAKHAAVP